MRLSYHYIYEQLVGDKPTSEITKEEIKKALKQAVADTAELFKDFEKREQKTPFSTPNEDAILGYNFKTNEVNELADAIINSIKDETDEEAVHKN